MADAKSDTASLADPVRLSLLHSLFTIVQDEFVERASDGQSRPQKVAVEQ